MHPDRQREFTEFGVSRPDSLIRPAYVLTNDQHAAEDLLQTALTKTAGHWRAVTCGAGIRKYVHSGPGARLRPGPIPRRSRPHSDGVGSRVGELPVIGPYEN